MRMYSNKITSRKRGTSFREREMEAELGHEENYEMSTYKMPFGRHKNLPITSVPVSYLEWARNSIKNNAKLIAEINKVLPRRI